MSTDFGAADDRLGLLGHDVRGLFDGLCRLKGSESVVGGVHVVSVVGGAGGRPVLVLSRHA